MIKKVNNFRANQTVWMHNEYTGEIMTGIISDKFCNKKYKFERIPVNLRTIIPVVWQDGKCGALHFSELKTVIN